MDPIATYEYDPPTWDSNEYEHLTLEEWEALEPEPDDLDEEDVPEYFRFCPETLEFAGFRLVEGQYEAIAPTPNGWYWSEDLQIYLGIYEKQLRFFTAEGALVPKAEEVERLRAEAEFQRAEAADQRQGKRTMSVRQANSQHY